MTTRKRRWLKILSLLLFISAGLFIEMTKLAPKRYKMRMEVIENDKIPKQFDQVSIAFFSDILSDFDNLDKAMQSIQESKPDLILFGGNISKDHLTEDEKNSLIEKLSEIQSPLGKYNVIAQLDTKYQNHEILEASGFKTLNSSGNLIYNGSQGAINIIGINEPLETSNELDEHFTIALMNDPDLSINVNYDLLLAGHNLGGQFVLPVFGPINQDITLYKKRVDQKDRVQMITSGLGTLKYDARLLTHPESVLIILKSSDNNES